MRKNTSAESSSNRAELVEVFFQECCRNWKAVRVTGECQSRNHLVFLH